LPEPANDQNGWNMEPSQKGQFRAAKRAAKTLGTATSAKTPRRGKKGGLFNDLFINGLLIEYMTPKFYVESLLAQKLQKTPPKG